MLSSSGLYHCLNRTTLFLLSRSTDSIADQMAVMEALHKLTNHRGLVFGAGNHELDFVGCLTYCLLQLTADMRIMLDTNIRTTWHVNPQMVRHVTCSFFLGSFLLLLVTCIFFLVLC